MSIKTWIRSWVKSPKGSYQETLSDILSNKDNREVMLGVQRLNPPSPEMIKNDIDKVIHYASSSGYKIWAEEAWSNAIYSIDKLMDSSLTPTEIDFYRGSLKQTFELLRISYKVRNMKEQAVRTLRNGI